MTEPRSIVPKLDGILAGSNEPVFRVLPQRVIEDMKNPRSESSLLWNSIYPRAQPSLAFSDLLSLEQLWGSSIDAVSDSLVPYYWGFDQHGGRMPQLDAVLDVIDGPGPQTEVDMFLLGGSELILVEAKKMGSPGRCGRYTSHRCPEIHPEASEPSCRYWSVDGSLFSTMLDFGVKPEPEDPAPSCSRHYQLGRTALVGNALASQLNRRLHIWLVIPRARWGVLERDWIDFSERIKDSQLWKRIRVHTWEDLRSLSPTP